MLESILLLALVIWLPILVIPTWLYQAGFVIFCLYKIFIENYNGHDKYEPKNLIPADQVDYGKVKLRSDPEKLVIPNLYGLAAKISSKLSLSFFAQNVSLKEILKEYDVDYFRRSIFPERQTHDPNCSLEFFEEEVEPKLDPIENKTQQDLIQEFFKSHIRDNPNSRIDTFLKKFEDQTLTPTSLCMMIISHLKEDKTNSFTQWNEDWILKQAEICSKNYENKTTRLLEGIPFAVKEMCHVEGFYPRCGFPFYDEQSMPKSEKTCATVVKLLNQGAILIGMTNMHQLGMGITGVNPSKGYKGGSKNPYSLKHFTGGSSSGSAAATAANLVCFAIGNDGGGSIRIPSSKCGVVGMKPTWGRVSLDKEEIDMATVAHSGPMTRSVADNVLIYGIIAGDDRKEGYDQQQGLPLLSVMNRQPILRLLSTQKKSYNIGYYGDWIEDSCKYAPNILRIFKGAVGILILAKTSKPTI